ncbi:MAG TPA: hypothetical protein VGF97_09105 [Rhizomicrobium sp.]|jgi:Flp pilus assembly pilin Flp
MTQTARRFATDASGVTTVEYGILAAILVSALILAVPAVGHGVTHTAWVLAASLQGPHAQSHN